jgi:hypothetical protein
MTDAMVPEVPLGILQVAETRSVHTALLLWPATSGRGIGFVLTRYRS